MPIFKWNLLGHFWNVKFYVSIHRFIIKAFRTPPEKTNFFHFFHRVRIILRHWNARSAQPTTWLRRDRSSLWRKDLQLNNGCRQQGKLWRSNPSRSKFHFIWWLNRLFINFFDPNLSSESESSWQNWLKHLKIISKRSKSIDFNRKEIESDWYISKSQSK